MSSFIPLSVPSIKGNEWKYIQECLRTEWVSTAGKFVDLFEQKITEYTGSKYAIACVNGTSALHTSLLTAGVKPNDEVIVPALTFIAPINTVRYCGAYPVFMDADKYYNIDTEKTIDFISKETVIKKENANAADNEWFAYNKNSGRRISAIIPVHVFGNAVRLDEIVKICKERNIKIIEDSTESLGTRYLRGKFNNKHAGTIGDLGCLSFNGNKIITTGGGGMILTDNLQYAVKAKYLTTQAKDDAERFIHNEIGYNYRLPNILAALGLAQLEQLPAFIIKKAENYTYYKNYIDNMEGLRLGETPEYADNNHWMYALQIDKLKYGKDKEQLMTYLKNNNIQTRPVWKLNHAQKAYENFQTYFIENAEILFQNTLNIPCSVNLNKEDIIRVIGKIIELHNDLVLSK